MLKYVKAFLIRKLSFAGLNFLRLIRGNAQFLLSKYCPEFFLSEKYKAIKLKHGGVSFSIENRWGNAFASYAEGSDKPIDLLWIDGPMPGNFGDWLSPYIIKSVSGQKITYIPNYSYFKKKHIIGVGSIANKINPYSHVFGSGIASVNDNVNPNATFHFVRGPYTRDLIMRLGGPKVDVLGDMGFILRKIYTPKFKEKDIELLFVRHITHQGVPLILPEYAVEHLIDASDPTSIQNFLDVIVSSRKVITSAMHCYIACKSYGVPCALVDFKDSKVNLFGDGIKYRDASEGAGLRSLSPFPMGLNMAKFNFDNIMDEEVVSENFVEDLYKHVHRSIQIYNEMNY